MKVRRYRVYDHRIKAMIAKSKDINLFPELDIPKSTARVWIKKGIPTVVTIPTFEFTSSEILNENIKLKRDIAEARAEHTLLFKTIRIFGFQIQYKRLPNAAAKSSILQAIKKGSAIIPLSKCLDIIGLSSPRFHSWKRRAKECLLEDNRGCPKNSPSRLTWKEISLIKEMVTDQKLAHYSISSLSWVGKKTQQIFASSTTWYRVVKEYNLGRPRHRLYHLAGRHQNLELVLEQLVHVEFGI